MSLKRVSALLAAAVCLSGVLSVAPSATAVHAVGPDGPTRVSVVLPLSVPDARNGLLSAATLAAYTAPSGLLTRELDSVIGTSVAIGIDPLVIASIRILGTSAPESAVDWLERLEDATNDTFALSWADADVTAPLQAGASLVLAPASLDFAIDPALFGPAAPAGGTGNAGSGNGSPTPAPNGTNGTNTPTQPVIPPLPTTEDLLAWDYSLGTVSWPVAGTVTPTDLSAITASGFTSTIVSSANARRASDLVAAASVDDMAIIVTDDALSAQLNATASATSVVAWEEAVTSFAAAVDGSGTASLVLAVDRGTIGGPPRLRTTVAALDALEGVDVVPLDDVTDAGETTAEIIEAPQSPERLALVAEALAAEAADAAFSTVAANPLLITAQRRIELLSTLAPTWDRYPTGWAGALRGFLDDSTDLRGSVSIVESSDLVFPDRGLLPITVSNTLDQAATVYIVVRPLSPLLAVENDWFELTIEPNSQKRALIPAVARSNGLVDLAVTINDRNRAQVGATSYVSTDVRAGWETPLTIALGLLVLMIFAVGIVRSIRRRRREAAALEEPAGLTSTDTPAASTGPAE